jgi:hypothetical protein
MLQQKIVVCAIQTIILADISFAIDLCERAPTCRSNSAITSSFQPSPNTRNNAEDQPSLNTTTQFSHKVSGHHVCLFIPGKFILDVLDVPLAYLGQLDPP